MDIKWEELTLDVDDDAADVQRRTEYENRMENPNLAGLPLNLVTTRREISQSDYRKYSDPACSMDDWFTYVYWASHFSEYPPAGYGMHSPRLETVGDAYYLVWERKNNCD